MGPSMDQNRWAISVKRPEEKAGRKTSAHSLSTQASLWLICLPLQSFQSMGGLTTEQLMAQTGRASDGWRAMRSVGKVPCYFRTRPLWSSDPRRVTCLVRRRSLAVEAGDTTSHCMGSSHVWSRPHPRSQRREPRPGWRGEPESPGYSVPCCFYVPPLKSEPLVPWGLWLMFTERYLFQAICAGLPCCDRW